MERSSSLIVHTLKYADPAWAPRADDSSASAITLPDHHCWISKQRETVNASSRQSENAIAHASSKPPAGKLAAACAITAAHARREGRIPARNDTRLHAHANPFCTRTVKTDHYFIITGASGAGKSTLLAELEFLGYSVVPEAGRAVLREQIACGSGALPWVDTAAYIAAVIERCIDDYESAAALAPPVFFDRGVPEIPIPARGTSSYERYRHALEYCRYNPHVFVTEPWQEIYINDQERLQDYETSLQWYRQSIAAYARAGYELHPVPKGTVRERTEFLLSQLTVTG